MAFRIGQKVVCVDDAIPQGGTVYSRRLRCSFRLLGDLDGLRRVLDAAGRSDVRILEDAAHAAGVAEVLEDPPGLAAAFLARRFGLIGVVGHFHLR